ncbi:hypothetical protein HDU91_005478 [Kappamyces sp. JEL0680]|nr:hypothetical protein HDU91_005478 [Kappamyces sp. JEL0680]
MSDISGSPQTQLDPTYLQQVQEALSRQLEAKRQTRDKKHKEAMAQLEKKSRSELAQLEKLLNSKMEKLESSVGSAVADLVEQRLEQFDKLNNLVEILEAEIQSALDVKPRLEERIKIMKSESEELTEAYMEYIQKIA